MSYDPPTSSPQFCGNCGQKLLKGATFCAYCGTPVPSAETPGAVTPKSPSEYSTMPPTVPPGTHPAYPPTYRPGYQMTEPPLPFLQHFQGVLLSPRLEMSRIAKRPGLKQPLVIVLISGILASIATIILFSRIDFTPEFIDDMFSSLGYSSDMFDDLDMDMQSFIRITFMLNGIFMPLSYLIAWIIVNTFILWILHAIISPEVSSHERNFKIIATITGWAFLPRVFEELINVFLVVFFIPQTEVSNMSDLTAIESFESAGELSPILLIISLLIIFISLIWSCLLVYFGSKTIDPEGSHAVVIIILYFLVRLVLKFVLPSLIGFSIPV